PSRPGSVERATRTRRESAGPSGIARAAAAQTWPWRWHCKYLPRSASRLPLFLQSRRQHTQHVRHAAPGICTRLRAIAVFLAEIFGHALGKAALVVNPGVDQLQPARPGQPLLAADLVRQSEDKGPVCCVFR